MKFLPFVTLRGVVLATALLLSSVPAFAANLYVATNGSDSASCTSSNPCRTIQRGVNRMNDGDTLFIRDGVYTSGTSFGGCTQNAETQVVIRNKNCPSGCTIRAANVNEANPRVILSGGKSGFDINRSDGWRIRGIKFDAPAGVHACNSSDLRIRDSVVHFQQEPAGTVYGLRLFRMNDVLLDGVRVHEKTMPCYIHHLGPDNSAHRAMHVTESSNIEFLDSYFGYTVHLGAISNTTNVTFRRTQFQHWSEHGLMITKGSGDILFENVIWGGTTWGHCWNGSNQNTINDTQCRSDADCAGEPANARSCRIDDCFCERTLTGEHPYCGTCNPPENAPNDYCWRAPRTIDVFEADGITVRNNTFAGHGYAPISAVYRNFTAENAYDVCTTYPGVCERDETIVCTEEQGDSYCGSRNAGRCIPICEVNDYKFYNNVVYDLMDQSVAKDPTYLRVPTQENAWNRHSNFHFDGNVYSGGAKAWTGCQEPRIRAARFNSDDPGVCWQGHLSSFYDQTCLSNSDCDRGTCNLDQWQNHECYGEPADPNSYWYPDIEDSFAGYAEENYEPSGPESVLVNAGVNGLDPDGVSRCAPNDFEGRPRSDGQCDVGAFELQGGEVVNEDDGATQPPGAVGNLKRADTRQQ